MERRAASDDGSVQLALAKRPAPLAAPAGGVMLPQTATDAELKMIAGAVLLTLGLIFIAFNRRRASSA
jgi:Ca-activated chloride channel family protein